MDGPSSQKIRISVVQACTTAFSQQETLSKLENYVTAAKKERSQLCVFPEAFIGGYPKYSTFGAVIGERSSSGRDEYLSYYNAAVEIPSSCTLRIQDIAKSNEMFIVVGVIEKDGGTLYCTALFVDPSKGIVGKHRKLVPTASERLIWGQGNGSTIPVVNYPFPSDEGLGIGPSVEAKISATICWENYMPLLRQHYYMEGVQLYCAPTVDSRPVWEHTMAHIALEGRCFVLSACQFSREKDYPPEHAVADPSNRDPENIVIAGGSMIVDPFGTVLAGPLRGEEGILTAEIDLGDCIRGKFDLDVAGHYARPDVFDLKVYTNQSARSTVRMTGSVPTFDVLVM